METIVKDVFLAYNSKEEPWVQSFVQQMEKFGISIFYYPRDVQIGDDWESEESKAIENTRLILVLLGKEGWGPTHLSIVENAIRWKRYLFPVLFDNPPKSAFEKANGLFNKNRYFDFRSNDDKIVSSLASKIKSILLKQSEISNNSTQTLYESPTDNQKLFDNQSQYDALVNRLIDGDEEDRSAILDQIRYSKNLNRSALSFRLRKEITGRFNQDIISDFARAIRDPKRIASIRSWMISSLIWTDVENPENRDLLLSLLTAFSEPEDFTRFWLLAGLYHSKASYLNTALNIAGKDKTRIIVLLAEAIHYRSSSQLINRMTEMILKGEFDETWMALRVLRIVAIPEMAPVLCEKLSYDIQRPLDYDILYALSNPGMSIHVISLLREKPGIRPFFNLLVNVTRDSDANATRNFASLLQYFDPSELNREFTILKSNPALQEAVDRLLEALRRIQQEETSGLISVAGYSSDTIDVSKDYLDISEDVATLTAIIMAKEVTPPLAIGLFGDWGSGKSFFMQSVRAEIDRMTHKIQSNPTSPFYTHFVHIEFNAWHYIDTNLMASLVSTIFEEMAMHVSPGPTAEEKQKEFLSQLASVKLITEEVESEKKRIEKVIKDKEDELIRIRKDKEEKLRLSDLNITDLKKLLTSNQKKDLDDALQEMGIPAVVTSVTDLNKVIGDLGTAGGRASSLFLSILRGKNQTLVIWLLGFILVLIPTAYWLLNHLVDLSQFYAKISVIAAEVITILSGIAIVLRNGLGKMRSWLEVIENTKSRIDTVLENKRTEPNSEEKILSGEIQRLKAKEDEAAAQLALAHTRIAEIESKLQRLKEEQSLSRFLYERSQTDDYRKHLGLISTVRKDFKTLIDRLKSGDDGSCKPVDRIVLYIDDLDRCPSEKVIEVLQAVHLLLAYPLFVVLVGVDPRWLLHSLDKSYDHFKNKTEEDDVSDTWRTTPQNFIEKIFQIPYNLKPMSEIGFEALMSRLFSPTISTRPVPIPVTVNEGSSDIIPEEKDEDFRTDIITSFGDSHQHEMGQQPGADFVSDSQEDSKKVFEISESSLEIREWELKYATSLLPFIPTPRAAKRFANIYRILKASVRQKDLAFYEGTPELPGDFQLPMALLAILTSIPEHAPALFESLSRSPAELNMKDAFKQAIKSIEDLNPDERVMNFLIKLTASSMFPSDKGLILIWLPKVARFSFEAGRVVK